MLVAPGHSQQNQYPEILLGQPELGGDKVFIDFVEEEGKLKGQLHKKLAESSAAFEEYGTHVEAMNTKFGDCVAIHQQMLDLASRKSDHEIEKRDQEIKDLKATIRQLEDAQSVQHNKEGAG